MHEDLWPDLDFDSEGDLKSLLEDQGKFIHDKSAGKLDVQINTRILSDFGTLNMDKGFTHEFKLINTYVNYGVTLFYLNHALGGFPATLDIELNLDDARNDRRIQYTNMALLKEGLIYVFHDKNTISLIVGLSNLNQ